MLRDMKNITTRGSSTPGEIFLTSPIQTMTSLLCDDIASMSCIVNIPAVAADGASEVFALGAFPPDPFARLEDDLVLGSCGDAVDLVEFLSESTSAVGNIQIKTPSPAALSAGPSSAQANYSRGDRWRFSWSGIGVGHGEADETEGSSEVGEQHGADGRRLPSGKERGRLRMSRGSVGFVAKGIGE
jgi:hypothetical protein